jgi:hypothetical protein
MVSRIAYFLISVIPALTVTNPTAVTTARNEGAARQTDQHAESAQTKKEADFVLVLMSHGVAEDGASFSQNTFKGPNGQKLFVVMIHYASPDDVKKRFEYMIAKAKKVIERQTVAGEKGAKEQRAVITFTARDKNEASMILITAGIELVEVQSYSLQDALEFEKQSKH